MSVTDPLIKDIKAAALKLHHESLTQKITDSSQNLENFCYFIEKTFYRGLLHNQTIFKYKKSEPYSWLSSINSKSTDLENFNYINSLDLVKCCKNVRTPVGKLRLLIRHCLLKKCLQFPIIFLCDSNKNILYYDKTSILGDPILVQILLSVILQCNRFNLQLQLSNSYFLDITWQIPELVKLELVPCESLGLTVSFAENRVVIVRISSNSVANENGQIKVGDILANLNGVDIDTSCKGRLGAILNSAKRKPIVITIIKALDSNSKLFEPMNEIIEKLNVDISNGESCGKVGVSNGTKMGHKGIYLGPIDVGGKGNVRQIEEAIKRCLRTTPKEQKVRFDIGEMDIKVFDLTSGDHSYMQIASCGSAYNLPNYVAYIVGDENCEDAVNFICHIFYINDVSSAMQILQSIGQGFYRTHFAV